MPLLAFFFLLTACAPAQEQATFTPIPDSSTPEDTPEPELDDFVYAEAPEEVIREGEIGVISFHESFEKALTEEHLRVISPEEITNRWHDNGEPIPWGRMEKQHKEVDGWEGDSFNVVLTGVIPWWENLPKDRQSEISNNDKVLLVVQVPGGDGVVFTPLMSDNQKNIITTHVVPDSGDVSKSVISWDYTFAQMNNILRNGIENGDLYEVVVSFNTKTPVGYNGEEPDVYNTRMKKVIEFINQGTGELNLNVISAFYLQEIWVSEKLLK